MFDKTDVRFWCLGCGNDLVPSAHSNGWYLDSTGRTTCPVAVLGDPAYYHAAAASSVPAETGREVSA